MTNINEIKKIEKNAVAKLDEIKNAKIEELKLKRAEAIRESKKAPRGTVQKVRVDLVWPIEYEMDRIRYKYFSAKHRMAYWAAKQIRELAPSKLNKNHKSAIKTYEPPYLTTTWPR